MLPLIYAHVFIHLSIQEFLPGIGPFSFLPNNSFLALPQTPLQSLFPCLGTASWFLKFNEKGNAKDKIDDAG